MKTSKLLAGMLAATLTLTPLAGNALIRKPLIACAEEITQLEQGLVFEENDGHMGIIGWTDGIPEELVIPADYFGVPVEFISPEAFKDCKTLKSVTLPDTIGGIGTAGFAGCENLESINLTDNIKIIGESAFQNCSKLKAIHISDSLEYMGTNAFKNCYELKDVDISDTIKPMGMNSFNGTPWLRDLEQGLVFEENDGHMGVIGWYENIPEELVIPADYFGTPIEYIWQEAFKDCKTLKSVTLPDTVSGIGYDAFAGCENLESINLTDNIKIIGESAFQNCSKLKAIHISDALEYMGTNAFKNCYELKDVDISDTIKPMGINSFYGTDWLRDLEQGLVFEENDGHMSVVGWHVYIPEELVIPADYFGIPVETIAPEAFKDCNTLKSVTLPDTVSGIGYDAFAGCENLESINLPEGLEGIGESAFQGCPKLKNIYIPASVEKIYSNAFGFNSNTDTENQVEGFSISGYQGTAAEAYALENDIPFIALNAESDILLGDVDNDGKVKIADVVLLQRYNNEEPVQISPEGRTNADVNHDGILSADDVTDILKAIARIKVLQ